MVDQTVAHVESLKKQKGKKGKDDMAVKTLRGRGRARARRVRRTTFDRLRIERREASKQGTPSDRRRRRALNTRNRVDARNVDVAPIVSKLSALLRQNYSEMTVALRCVYQGDRNRQIKLRRIGGGHGFVIGGRTAYDGLTRRMSKTLVSYRSSPSSSSLTSPSTSSTALDRVTSGMPTVCPGTGSPIDHGTRVHHECQQACGHVLTGRPFRRQVDPCVAALLHWMYRERKVPIRSEWPIYDEHMGVATAVDLVLYDLKRHNICLAEIKTGSPRSTRSSSSLSMSNGGGQRLLKLHSSSASQRTENRPFDDLRLEDTAIYRGMIQLLYCQMIARMRYSSPLSSSAATSSSNSAASKKAENIFSGGLVLNPRPARGATTTAGCSTVVSYRLVHWCYQSDVRRALYRALASSQSTRSQLSASANRQPTLTIRGTRRQRRPVQYQATRRRYSTTTTRRAGQRAMRRYNPISGRGRGRRPTASVRQMMKRNSRQRPATRTSR